jgi:hypothetical protein
MFELSSILAAYTAFACLYLADARQRALDDQAPWRSARPARFALRLLAVLAFTLACWCWRQVEPGAAIILVPLTAFMVAAALIVVLVPIAPRLLLAFSALVPALIAALLALGSARAR